MLVSTPLAHFGILHPQHFNNLRTHCVGGSEEVTRGLVWYSFSENALSENVVSENVLRDRRLRD